VEHGLKIRVETLMLGLDYLEFLASIKGFEDRVGDFVDTPMGTYGTPRNERHAVMPENPGGFATDAGRIDGILKRRCGAPNSIEQDDWTSYYECTLWQSFKEAFLDPNHRVTTLLRATIDVSALFGASKVEIASSLVDPDFEKKAEIFSRLLALLEAEEITAADLK